MSGDRSSPSLPREVFYSQLHPVLRERLGDLLQDLRDRGWNPRIPQLGGMRATGFRSLAAQARAQADGRSGVTFGFHTIRDRLGKPSSLAVHVTDPSQYGNDPALKQKFQEDLLAAAERFGMTTGLHWKGKDKRGNIVAKPDPLHVQLGEQAWLGNKATLAGLKRGIIPPLPQPRPRITHPGIASALGQGFRLKSIFQPKPIESRLKLWSPPKAPPPPVRPKFDPGSRMTLRPPLLGGDIAKPPWRDITRQPFRPVDRPFHRPVGFGGMALRRPDILRPSPFSGPMKLKMPALGSSLGLGRPAGPSLGNFQLKLKPF